MPYVFLSADFPSPFYFCEIPEPKGFKLSNRLQDALQVESKELINPTVIKLKEQSGIMEIEVKRL